MPDTANKTHMEKQIDKLERDNRESRDLLIEIRTGMTYTQSSIDTLHERINERKTDIDEVARRTSIIENQISGFRGQMIMLKIVGGLIGLIFAGLEAYRIFSG